VLFALSAALFYSAAIIVVFIAAYDWHLIGLHNNMPLFLAWTLVSIAYAFTPVLAYGMRPQTAGFASATIKFAAVVPLIALAIMMTNFFSSLEAGGWVVVIIATVCILGTFGLYPISDRLISTSREETRNRDG
jgi:hypothetical protein